MATISWVKSTGGTWLPFETVNLSTVNTTGCYVIWHGGQNPWTVRVGQGDIAKRIITHRGDHKILGYRSYGGLWVTWAAVTSRSLDGVERYLADQLRPRVGDKFPDAAPIPVNLPWAA